MVFLPRSLWLLRMLELRGLARRMLKQMKRPAGALFVLIYVCMFLPSLLNAFMVRGISPQLASESSARSAFRDWHVMPHGHTGPGIENLL